MRYYSPKWIADPNRILDRVIMYDGDACWEWRGAHTRGGYGVTTVNGVQTTAHRAVWMLLRGRIPAGKQLDHLCRNRGCVRPSHLEAVTPKENTARGSKASRATCINGHPYTPENTYHVPPYGHRRCRICTREFNRRWLRKRRDADRAAS